MKRWNYETLFKDCFKILKDQIDRHDVSCGCQDGKDAGSEGLCPGLKEAKKFIDKVERLVHQS